MMKKLEAKLRSLDACEEDIADAMQYSTPHEAWEKVGDLNLIWIFIEIADEKSIHHFGLWAARQVQHLMTDPRSIAALDVKEKWLKGEATDEELKIARAAANSVRVTATDADYAARAARAARVARAAAYYATRATADADAYAADAAYYASHTAYARAAADYASHAAARAADAARAAQAAWIRENFTPDFEKLLGTA